MKDLTLNYIAQTSFVTTGYQALFDWKREIWQPLQSQGKPLTPQIQGMQFSFYPGQYPYSSQLEMTTYNASSVQMRAMGPMGGHQCSVEMCL